MSDRTPRDDDRRLDHVLARLSAHCGILAGQIKDVEDLIGDAAAGADSAQVQHIPRLQALDFVRQSLEDMEILTMILSNDHGLARTRPIAAHSISAKLRLETTRQLLGVDRDAIDRAAAAGELDLF